MEMLNSILIAAIATAASVLPHTPPTVDGRFHKHLQVAKRAKSDYLPTQPITFQSPAADVFDSLKHRYQTDDIDGIGEIIIPLISNMKDRSEPELSLPEKHLMAAAAVKFYVRRGEFSKSVVPFLIAQNCQQRLTETGETGRVEFLDGEFQRSYLPPLFLTDAQQQRVGSEINAAIDAGELERSPATDRYLSPQKNELSAQQSEMLAAISAARSTDPIKDRQILKLVQHFVVYREDHYRLTHQSLALAIERLEQDRRLEEANRLRAVFRTHFSDSRRISK